MRPRRQAQSHSLRAPRGFARCHRRRPAGTRLGHPRRSGRVCRRSPLRSHRRSQPNRPNRRTHWNPRCRLTLPHRRCYCRRLHSCNRQHRTEHDRPQNLPLFHRATSSTIVCDRVRGCGYQDTEGLFKKLTVPGPGPGIRPWIGSTAAAAGDSSPLAVWRPRALP
jgi:hypothetical protein